MLAGRASYSWTRRPARKVQNCVRSTMQAAAVGSGRLAHSISPSHAFTATHASCREIEQSEQYREMNLGREERTLSTNHWLYFFVQSCVLFCHCTLYTSLLSSIIIIIMCNHLRNMLITCITLVKKHVFNTVTQIPSDRRQEK